MKRLIIILILLLAIINPLVCDVTEDQVTGWWLSLTEEEKIEVLLKYASIVNSFPVITLPDYFAVIVGNDILVTPQEGGIIKIGHLEYELTFKEMIFEDLVQFEQEYTNYLITGGICIVTGLAVGFFLFGGK